MDMISIVRQQIRSVVDPMFLRLIQRLYGHPNATQLRDDVIPTTAITTAVHQMFQTDVSFVELSLPLGETLSVGDCVYVGADQSLYRVSASNTAHAGLFIGVVKALTTTQGTVCVFGRLSLPSVWSSFNPASFVYLSQTGSVTQTPPTVGFRQRVGIALASSSVFVFPFDHPTLL